MEALTIIVLFILGSILGSYLNSWIWRYHRNHQAWPARSVCVHCLTPIAWFDNIPLFSFVRLKGRSRCCNKPIPTDYFFVELASGCVMATLGVVQLYSSASTTIFFYRVLVSYYLLVVFVYDLKYQEIIPGLVWLGTIAVVWANVALGWSSTSSMALGAFVAAGFFFLQYVISRGTWIGGGDVRFGVFMGALLGWPYVLVAVGFSYVFGALVSVPLVMFKKKAMNSAIPFGTFLSVGTWLTMIFGASVVSWYLNIVRW